MKQQFEKTQVKDQCLYDEMVTFMRAVQTWEISAETAATELCRMILTSKEDGMEEALRFIERRL